MSFVARLTKLVDLYTFQRTPTTHNWLKHQSWSVKLTHQVKSRGGKTRAWKQAWNLSGKGHVHTFWTGRCARVTLMKRHATEVERRSRSVVIGRVCVWCMFLRMTGRRVIWAKKDILSEIIFWAIFLQILLVLCIFLGRWFCHICHSKANIPCSNEYWEHDTPALRRGFRIKSGLAGWFQNTEHVFFIFKKFFGTREPRVPPSPPLVGQSWIARTLFLLYIKGALNLQWAVSRIVWLE